jgi:hypothetical protein
VLQIPLQWPCTVATPHLFEHRPEKINLLDVPSMNQGSGPSWWLPRMPQGRMILSNWNLSLAWNHHCWVLLSIWRPLWLQSYAWASWPTLQGESWSLMEPTMLAPSPRLQIPEWLWTLCPIALINSAQLGSLMA